MIDRYPQGEIAERLKGALLFSALIPELGCPVAPAAYQLAISMKLHGKRPPSMGIPAADLPAVFHLPEAYGRIFTGARYDVRVGSPAHRGYRAAMPPEGQVFAPGHGFPYVKTAVAISRCQEHSIRTELEGEDPVGVLLDVVQQFPVAGRVDSQHLAGPTKGDHAVVAGDVGRENRVVLVADLYDSLSGTNVPEDNLSRVGPSSTACQEQPGVAAELEYVRRSLWKGKHSGQLAGVRIVEQHLLLSCDGHQRRPGAAGHRRHSAGLLRSHHRLQAQPSRHWRRTLRFRSGLTYRELEPGLGGKLDLAAFVFRRASRDPLSNSLQDSVRKLAAFWGHVRLFKVGDEGEEAAGAGLPGLDHLPGASALHRQAVGVESEPALLAVLVVTFEALGSEDLGYVIIVGDPRLLGRSVFAAGYGGGACHDEAAEQGEQRRGRGFSCW